MSQGPELAHRIFGEGKAGFVCVDVEGENATIGAVILLLARMISFVSCKEGNGEKEARTRLVALCSVHNDSFESTRSPREKGRELPFEIAEATADLRKSIVITVPVCWYDQNRPYVVDGRED